MCWAMIGGIAQGAGTGMNILGKKQEGKAQAEQLNAMAGMSTQKAREARLAGRRTLAQHKATLKQFIGSQKAAAAGSGTDVNVGTNVDLIAESARGGEVDAQAIRYNAESEANVFRNQARMYRAGAKNAKKGVALSSNASLLTSAGQFADRYYSYSAAR